MKNFIKNHRISVLTVAVLFTAFTFVIITSCQKDRTINNDLKNNQTTDVAYKVKVVDNRLVFETQKDYEQTIEYLTKLDDENFAKWENEIGFSSMRKNFNEAECEKIGIIDPLLATLLNTDGIIQIEKNVFKIDVPSETVKVIDALNFSNKNSFARIGYETFSTNDNVLEMIDKKNKNVKGIGCGNACGEGINKEKDYTSATSGQINMKVVYQRAGVYFSLEAKIKKINNISSKGVFIYLSGDVSYTKCGENKGKSDSKSYGGNAREYNWRPAYGMSRLKAFNFNVWFRVNDNSDPNNPYNISMGISCN